MTQTIRSTGFSKDWEDKAIDEMANIYYAWGDRHTEEDFRNDLRKLLKSQKKEILSQWEQAITYSQEKGHYLNRHIMLNHFREASK